MSDEQQIDTAGAVAAYLNPDQGQPAQAAKAAMAVAAGSNPEFEAELRRVADRTGVPLDAARAYPDEVKRQAALQAHDFDALARQFPGTTRFLADPDNARVAHDDVANLSSTEAAIGPIRGPKPTFWTYATGLMKSLPQGAGMAREGIRMQLADLFGFDAVRADAQRNYGQLALEQQVDTPDFAGSTARGVYGGLTSTVRAVPGLAASIATRSPAPLLAAIGVQAEADAYGKYRNRGASAGQALGGAVAEGAVEVGTELLPMSFLVKNLGKTGAGHFLTGLLAREVPGEQVATLVQDAIDTAIANPDKTWGQYLDERPDAAYQTLLATITQAGLMEGANATLGRVQGRAQEAQHAGQVSDALSQFNALAEASKVRERDAGTAQAFFQSLMQEGRDTVWITPQALAESGMLEQMAAALPDVAAQLEQAANTGADIRIPVAELVAKLAGPELEQSIIPHLSEEPGGFTKASAEAYLASGAASELADEVKRTLADKQHDDAFSTSRAAVTAQFQAQLDTAGRFAPAVNQAYATMVGNFYAVQAARMGITPEEMAERYPLQVKAEAMPGVRTLDQPGTTESLVKELQAAYPDLKLDVMDSRGRINVSRIVLPQEQRGQGTGTKIMQQLIAHADATGKTLTLTPAADFGGSVPRLKKFYKALGFVENKGKRKDYEISESMYRPPAKTLSQSASDTRTIEVGGVRRAITNSKGQLVAQDFAGQKAFWEWFGDSKAVDEQGRPLMVYHGTTVELDGGAFRPGEKSWNDGIFFTSSPRIASLVYANGEGRISTGAARRKLNEMGFDKIDPSEAEMDAAWALTDRIRKGNRHFQWEPDDLGSWLPEGQRKSLAQQVTEYVENAAQSDNPDVADALGDALGVSMRGAAEGGNVIPTYLKMENPKIVDGTGLSFDDGMQDGWIAEARAAGNDGLIIRNYDDGGTGGLEHYQSAGRHTVYIVFSPEQVKSATGNDGTFDANDPNILSQQDEDKRRGMMSFGDDITAQPTVITLLKNADLSTFLHESGHFFLEVMNDIASRPDAPADIAADMAATLAWFGVPDLATWNAMDLEAKRPHHEAFARGFEAYLFEGRAPTADLTGLFSRFRSWLVNVYQSLTALQVDLSNEVRGVFDRMLASNEAIAQAEREAALAGMFGTRPEFMTEEEWIAYRQLSVKATEDATRALETRSLKDMKWLGNAKSKMLRQLQQEANFKRLQILNEVRKEVMGQPVYQAWQFLTLRGSVSTRAWPTPDFKLDPKHLDTRVDNLYAAIAKLGGLNRDEVKTKWGVDHRDMPGSGVFGMPVLRKNGGLSIDRMAEKLTEEHYLDSHDLAEFEDKFDRQRSGQEQYSWEYQYSNGERPAVEPLGDSNYHGKLDTKMLRHMYGEDMFGAEPDVVRTLIGYRMTSADGGLDPDVVAEMLGGQFASGRALVDALVAAEKPSIVINALVDRRMLERHGDLVDEAAIDRAVNEALHQKAHLRFVQTELAALQKAVGKPAVLAKAAQAYAEQIVRRTPINQLRPDRFTAAAKRAGRAADKAFKGGDIATAAAEKQAQLINAYAAKAALDARNEVEKTLVRFKTITNGSNDKVAKTRDLDMVMATRAILAEYGVGTRGKKATEYLAAVDAYDPAMAAVLRERIDAATEHARPLKELTIEELGALRDEVESLWFLAKRSRQMEVDGDLLDRQEIQEALAARLAEIGIPAEGPGAQHAITPGEVSLSKLQSLRAALRRVEAWAGAKDGANPMGPFRRFIWNTIKDHADAYRADKARYLKRYRDLLDTVAPTLTQVKIAAPELAYTFGFDKGGMGKVELLHALLHTGNASNKKKLLLGRRWADEQPDGTLNTARWDAFVTRMIQEGTLTRADFDFAQGVWDLLEEMKPAAQKAHRDVFGRYFDEVTADPFKVVLGGVAVDYRGGYVPAIADSRIVTDAKTRAIMEEESASLMNALPSTSKGFTKARVEYNRPLLLDLRLLAQHIDKVLLFSHLEQPVRDVRRVLGHSSVAAPLHLVDPAAYDGLLVPWLNRAARQQVETPVSGSNGLMRFFSVVRSRAGMAAMFANVSNTAQQVTGFSLAALKVKPTHLLAASVDFIRDPKAMAQAVAEASPYMANRMENEVGAMTDAINDILLNPGVYQRAVGWTQRHTYFMQSAMDNVMGPIIWHGAYNQALESAPAGIGDAELQLYARRLADSAVRETQGSTLPEDISRIETGTAFVRLFTQFAGYFNMQANLLGTEFAKVAQETGLRKGLGRGFYLLLLGFLMPAWGAQAIALAFRGGPDDEDKDGSYLDDWIAQTFGWGTLRAGTALVPVVGQTVNALANTFNGKPYDDKISTGPAISMIESAASVPSDVYKLATGEGSATKTVRDVASLVSLMLGVPATALARPIAYLTDINSGKAKPTGLADTARGLVTGASSPPSKGR